MFTHNKLVRDKIPDIISAKGEKPKFRVLSNIDYIKELNKKLVEEVNEYLTAETNENAVEELADVMEVIYAIANVKNCAPEVIETIRKDKSEKRGGFQKKLFLESVE